jgi:nitrogen fixation protein
MKVFYIAATPKGEVELCVFEQKQPTHGWGAAKIAKAKWHLGGKAVPKATALAALMEVDK